MEYGKFCFAVGLGHNNKAESACPCHLGTLTPCCSLESPAGSLRYLLAPRHPCSEAGLQQPFLDISLELQTRTMAFPPYSFDGPFQDFHLDVPAYQGQQLFAELGLSDSNELVGAEVLNHSLVPWSHPAAMQRFLKDNHRPILFNPMPQSQPVDFGVPVTPMPPANAAALHLHDSPPQSQEQSSCTSSNARSPRADTDMFTENAPSTPPDMSFASSLRGGPFDPFDLHAQHFLTGMGGCPGDACAGVSMADINPAEETLNEWAESPHVVDFTCPPQRSFTLDSHSSMPFDSDANTTSQAPVEPLSYQSPGMITIAKSESIQTQPTTSFFSTAKGPYPTPSIGESEESGADIDVASPLLEDEEDDDDDDDDGDDDDDEYQPCQKQKTATSPDRPVKNKRPAPNRPLDKASPKRPKTALVTPRPARPLPSVSGSRTSFPCSECSVSFKDETSLQSHIKKTHTRPFICVFRFAGCQSTFASKNEWKRHVMSQHLVLTYWLCDIESCAYNSNTSLSHSKSNSGRSRGPRRTSERMITLEPIGPPLPNGAIFNRKDLYTQHLRRMHTPFNGKKLNKTSKATTTGSGKTSDSDWEEQIKSHQSRAHRERCKLPTKMQCPANHCDVDFSGTDAWDQRMEHVAKHLEKAATGAEDPVAFGGPTDPSLMAWVTSPDVAVVREVDAGKWILNNPLRSASEGRGVGRRRDVLPSTVSLASRPLFGTPRTMSLSFSASAPTAVGSENDEIVVEGGEEDAEGEEE